MLSAVIFRVMGKDNVALSLPMITLTAMNHINNIQPARKLDTETRDTESEKRSSAVKLKSPVNEILGWGGDS